MPRQTRSGLVGAFSSPQPPRAPLPAMRHWLSSKADRVRARAGPTSMVATMTATIQWESRTSVFPATNSVDPLLFCEAFETRTVQGGFRSGLDPLPESRLSRLSLLCHRRNGAEKRTPSAAHQILRPTSLMFTAISCASGNLMASASICGQAPAAMLIPSRSWNRERSSTVRNEPPTSMLAPIPPPTVSSAEAIAWRGPPLQHRAKPAALPSP
jgi:hypothetical protein